MANSSVDGKPVWYPLSAHDDNASPLGPPTPTQSPSGVGTRTSGNGGRSMLYFYSWIITCCSIIQVCNESLLFG